MAMKRTPVTISPSGRVPEQESRNPELGFRDGGGSDDVFWKIMPAPRVLGRGGINRRRHDLGGALGIPGGRRARPHHGVRGAHLAPLLMPFRL